MQDPITFAAQCPNCKNEVTQGPRDPVEIRKLLNELTGASVSITPAEGTPCTP